MQRNSHKQDLLFTTTTAIAIVFEKLDNRVFPN